MDEGLLSRVRKVLAKKGLKDENLQFFLRYNGIRYELSLLDVFAEPRDISLIADYLEIPRSHLFEVTTFVDEFVHTVFEEYWPLYAEHLNMQKHDAWLKVLEGRESKGGEGTRSVRENVFLTLEGLKAPAATALYCHYLDCDCENRGLICEVTGWPLGPEG